MTLPIPAAIRQLLVCPRCHGPLRDTPAGAARNAPIPGHESRPSADAEGLGCDACHLIFPVRDGIPVMLLDQAAPMGG